MEENLSQVSQAPQVPQKPEIQIQPPKPLLKIILISLFGLILASGLIYTGVQIGKKQPQISAYPTPTPTAQTERIDCQTDSDCVLVIGKKDCCSCPTPVNKSELARNENLKIYQQGEILEKGRECEDIACSPCPWWNKAICESGLCKGVADLTLTPPSIPTSAPDQTAEWKTYKDKLYGYAINFPSSWVVNPFTNKDDYYNVTRSGVTFKKARYEVMVNNYGKIPKSGCGSLITSKNNFVKINVPALELWRPKIEEGKVDGMVAVNPQGAEFVTLNLGTFEKVQTTAPNTDGSLDCNFLVNNYRYEISYKFPVVGEDNLKNIDKEVLAEMDKIVSSIVWAE